MKYHREFYITSQKMVTVDEHMQHVSKQLMYINLSLYTVNQYSMNMYGGMEV
jgi:hypothetical protein